MTEKKRQNTKNLAIFGGVILLIIVGLVLSSNKNLLGAKALTPDEAKAAAEKFIKGYLVSADTQFTVGQPKAYNAGLYEMDITLQDNPQPIKSYLTKDGKLFIPQAMDIAEVSGQGSNKTTADSASGGQTPAAVVATKSDKPKVELFVMSYCPYGTQMEKGILPVAQTLGNKIDFQVKFVNYAMHGEKEITENLRQYCISKDQGAKYNPYLTCFLKAGDAAACLKETGINEAKVNSCVTGVDKQYKIMETFNKGESAWGSSYPPFPINDADNKKYGVQGSPTLVINGQEISSGRDSASLAATICGAFTDGKKPAECDKTFASAAPTPGFGEGTTDSSNNAANCAPAN